MIKIDGEGITVTGSALTIKTELALILNQYRKNIIELGMDPDKKIEEILQMSKDPVERIIFDLGMARALEKLKND